MIGVILVALLPGQVTFDVPDVTPTVAAKVHLDDAAQTFSPGWVAIIDKASKKELFRVSSQELAVDLRADGQPSVGVRELPYGRQSVVMALDVDFDGQVDLVVMDGQNSCYHGPSFQVFLSKRGKFEKSEPFTSLAQDYCGMFDVDAKAKRLHTVMKDGCCSHELTDFEVVNGVPKVERVVSVDARQAPLVTTTTEQGGARVSEERLDFSQDPAAQLFRFALPNGKRCVLFTQDQQLRYAFLNARGLIELLYPRPDQEGSFTRAGPLVSFSNGSTGYTVDTKAPAIVVRPATGKEVRLEGVPGSVVGSLDGLGALQNVR